MSAANFPPYSTATLPIGYRMSIGSPNYTILPGDTNTYSMRNGDGTQQYFLLPAGMWRVKFACSLSFFNGVYNIQEIQRNFIVYDAITNAVIDTLATMSLVSNIVVQPGSPAGNYMYTYTFSSPNPVKISTLVVATTATSNTVMQNQIIDAQFLGDSKLLTTF